MIISNDYTIVVPHDWSGEEALTVVDFLERIVQAIWNLHNDTMMVAMRRRNAASGRVKYQPPNVEAELVPCTPSSVPDDE